MRNLKLAFICSLLMLFLQPAWANTLPDGLQWQSNNTDPVFSSDQAVKGGTFRTYMLGFPLTLRTAGPDSNGIFRNYTSAFSMSLVGIHPQTRNPIPILATDWAFDDNGKTIYYKLDPSATWSDGKPVTADDYLFTLEFSRSNFIKDPYLNDYFTTRIINVTKYDDYTISIEGADAKPREEIFSHYAIGPTPEHFHKLDEKWIQNYNWKIEPSAGPYTISKIRKGKYIEFSRIKDWWGKDKQYFKGLYNPDKIKISVIRDENIAYKYFLKGDLDAFWLSSSLFWHDKAVGKPYDYGYIHKLWFYNDSPRSPQGFYLNQDDPMLADLNVRIGVSHAMHVEKVLKTVMRGDYLRLKSFNQGYGDYSNTDIVAREFSIEKASKYFDLAGWNQRGPDGIRIKEGKRLSIVLNYSTPKLTKRLVIHKEEAKKSGLELVLKLMDNSSNFKYVLEKKHQIASLNWGTGMFPSYWSMYHSDNAHKPQTVNVTNMDDPELDTLIIGYRDATTKADRTKLAKLIQQAIFDKAVFIPDLDSSFNREAYWRWMKYPDNIGTKVSKAMFEPSTRSDWSFWIDKEEKEKTKAARKKGIRFEPVTIIDTTYKSE
ncbi:MAG TPA: ABC transporter substrate-binding protein [Porticoccus sp.]|nr:ABC transporter substrate-binding protein [Porticoccus sp.]